MGRAATYLEPCIHICQLICNLRVCDGKYRTPANVAHSLAYRTTTRSARTLQRPSQRSAASALRDRARQTGATRRAEGCSAECPRGHAMCFWSTVSHMRSALLSYTRRQRTLCFLMVASTGFIASTKGLYANRDHRELTAQESIGWIIITPK